MRTAVIAGATGLVGKQCMYKLLENKEYSSVIALLRRPFDIKHPKLQQITTDFENLNDLTLPFIPDDVFCCLGTTMAKAGSKQAFYKVDFTYVHELGSFFASKGSKRFLLISASGADKTSAIYYSKVKGEVEEAVKQLSFDGIYVFRPSILLGSREEFRLGERVGIGLAMLLQPFMIGGLKKYRPIYGSQVAAGMIKTALEAAPGKYIFESDAIMEMVKK